MEHNKKEKLLYDKVGTGRRIKALREKTGATYQEMADMLGGAAQDYAELEQGKRIMTPEAAAQTASYFDVTVDFLIYGIDRSVSTRLPENKEDEMLLELLESSRPEQREMALKLMQTYLLWGGEMTFLEKLNNCSRNIESRLS